MKPEYGNHSFETHSWEREEIERMALEMEFRKGHCLFFFF